MVNTVSTKGKTVGVAAIFASGTALFSDGYANNVIGLVETFMTRIYGSDAFTAAGGATDAGTILSSVGFAGMVVGMLTFGYLSDKMGRKFGMMTAASLVAFFSLLSAASEGAGDSLKGTVAMLSFCRFMLGIGIGAEYPTGSVSAAENTEDKSIAKNAQHRWFALATNTMIDVGFVISAFVALVLYWICGDNHLRAAWRLLVGLGFVPAIAVLIWRWNLAEPERYKESSMAKMKVPYRLIIKRYWPSLAAISAAWFIYDFITYPFGLYASTVTNTITNGNAALSVVLGWSVVINLFYIPGTIIGAFSVDFLGPKSTMIIGLVMQAIVGFIMSGLYSKLESHIAAFAVLYGIFLSFGEFGPGNCLGLLASKSGPTAVRGQYYGIAAAIGKIGAFAGTWAFKQIIKDFGSGIKGTTGPFWVGSAMTFVSAIITFFFVKPLTADGMTEEDKAFREYLEANGVDTSQMGLHEDDLADGQESKEDEKSPEGSVVPV